MRYLFVCTGNTCRSPMAQCLMAHFYGQQPCQSAGLFAVPGEHASRGAQEAMAAWGLSLKQHRAQAVTPQLLEWADEVWAMTPGHLEALTRAYPAYQGKYRAFSPAIPDPYGSSAEVYRSVARLIRDQLAAIAGKP